MKVMLKLFNIFDVIVVLYHCTKFHLLDILKAPMSCLSSVDSFPDWDIIFNWLQLNPIIGKEKLLKIEYNENILVFVKDYFDWSNTKMFYFYFKLYNILHYWIYETFMDFERLFSNVPNFFFKYNFLKI